MDVWDDIPSSQMVQPMRNKLYVDPSMVPQEPTPAEMGVIEQGRISGLLEHFYDEIAEAASESNHRFVKRAMQLQGETLAVQRRFINSTEDTFDRAIAVNYAKQLQATLFLGTSAVQSDLVERHREVLNRRLDVPRQKPAPPPSVVLEAEDRRLTMADRLRGKTTVYHQRVIPNGQQ